MLGSISLFFRNASFFIYENFLKPFSKDEDDKRREFILNVLLVSLIVLLSVQTIIVLYSVFTLGSNFHGASLWSIVIVLSVFVLMYLFARRGFAKHVAFIFVWTFYILLVYAMTMWGVDVPQVWLFFALVIAFAGMLVSTRMSFVMTAAVGITFIVLIHFQETGQLVFDRSWKNFPFRLTDAVGACVTFFIFTIVSWLSNREIHRSLNRARVSERLLKEERDSLEVKVEERTRDLVAVQEARLQEVERFAEFGQLASGIMHDLANPLTAISLNLDLAESDQRSPAQTVGHIKEAVSAAQRMEALLKSARKQIMRTGGQNQFSLSDEIEQVSVLLGQKAKTAQVRIDIDDVEHVRTVGMSIKFFRVMMNLMSNAIDAYSDRALPQEKRVIHVTCKGDEGRVRITVEDKGVGIAEESLEKIFLPFFTTKHGSGSGLGLPTAKAIVEKDFGGTLSVASRVGKGTIFTIEMPIRKE